VELLAEPVELRLQPVEPVRDAEKTRPDFDNAALHSIEIKAQLIASQISRPMISAVMKPSITGRAARSSRA
jgi:hypothetical protein